MNVTWEETADFVSWLNSKVEGRPYRLPSEAEWEYAARAGSSAKYSWGSNNPVCNSDAPNGANFKSCGDKRTHNVGSYPANSFGVHDMHGNVWEWVRDCRTRYVNAPTDGSVGTDCDPRFRVIRGGSWFNGPYYLTAYDRDALPINDRRYVVGFRVAKSL